MKKFMVALALMLTSLMMFGCGDSAEDANLMTQKNVNVVLDDFRSFEKEIGYEIHDVKYGENNGEHFCSAVFDKQNRGSVYFTVNEKGSLISVKFLMTEATNFDLGYQGGFLLARTLVAVGLTQDEIQNFLKEETDYLNAEIAKQQNPVAPTVDREFKIVGSKINKTIAVRLKADEKELSYTVSLAK